MFAFVWDWAVPDPSKKGIEESFGPSRDVQCGDHETDRAALKVKAVL